MVVVGLVETGIYNHSLSKKHRCSMWCTIGRPRCDVAEG